MSELSVFEYAHDGTMLKGRLATPKGEGPNPGVLVMHSAHGLDEQVCRRASLLADAGYVALATDMYGGGRCFGNPAEAGVWFAALQKEPQRLRERVVAAFEAFRALSLVDRNRIGAIGFCFGGQCVLELARSGADVKAVVSFHGLLNSWQPARDGEVKAKVLAISGARDPYAPKRDLEAFQTEMTTAHVDWQMTIYGEGLHAFSDPHAAEWAAQRPGIQYDSLLDRLSWAQANAYLDAMVKGV